VTFLVLFLKDVMAMGDRNKASNEFKRQAKQILFGILKRRKLVG